MNLDLFITLKCNFECDYCTVSLKNSFISLEELHEINFKDYEVINILGGEPFLHPEFEKIINYIKQYNQNIIIYTNGTKLLKIKEYEYLFTDNIKIVLSLHNQLFFKLKKNKDDYLELFNKKYILRTQIIFNIKNSNIISLVIKLFSDMDIIIYLCTDIEDPNYYQKTLPNLKKIFLNRILNSNILSMGLINFDIGASRKDYCVTSTLKEPNTKLFIEDNHIDFCSLNILFDTKEKYEYY